MKFIYFRMEVIWRHYNRRNFKSKANFLAIASK